MRNSKTKLVAQASLTVLMATGAWSGASAKTVASDNASAAPTDASASTASATGLGEIVVTANRREQSIQSVAISITALSGDDMRRLGVTQTTDITAQTPGLKFNQYSPALTVFNIRGVSQNNFGDQLEAPVAVYMDDAYVAVMGAAGMPTFDLQRVEVLRGPQGTLFGRNATGGLINFVSAPTTKTLEAFLDVNGGTLGNFHATTAVSGPLAENVQARLSATVNEANGYIKNSLGPDGGNQNNYAFRGQLNMQPLPDLNIKFIGRFAQNYHEHTTPTSELSAPDADGRGYFLPANSNYYGFCPGCDALGYKIPTDRYTVSSGDDPIFHRTIYGGQTRIDLVVGSGTITSITDYLHMAKIYREDSDATPNPIFNYVTTDSYHQFSEELKYSGKSGPFRYTFGGYYLNFRTNVFSRIDSEDFLATPDAPLVGQYTGIYNLVSRSIYGQGEFDVTDRLTGTFGIRYVNDRRTADYVLSETGFDDLVFNPQTAPAYAVERFKDYAMRAALNYKIATKVLVYASFNRGIKGPNFDAPSFQPFAFSDLPYKPERLNAYETGVKSTFLDGKLRLNLSMYLYQYKDYQAYFTRNFQALTSNNPAHAKGLELEVVTLPFEGLSVSGGIALESSKVLNVGLPSGRIVDTELPQAPGFSGNLVFRYEHPVSSALKVNFQFDASYTGSSYFDIVQEPVNREPAYGVGNIQINLVHFDDKWSFGVFSRNFWDQRYRVYSADNSFIGGGYNIYAEPRWSGFQLHYKY